MARTPRSVSQASALILAVLAAGGGRADEAYDRYRQPDKLIAALGLAPGQRVADVGAGGGYLTVRLAAAVGPSGRVVATDVNDEALAVLRGRTAKLPNVVVRKVEPAVPGLEPAAFDLVLLSEVDQYLPDRADYLRKLRAALAPRGRIAVTNRMRFRDPVVAAAAAAGYTVRGEMSDLPNQFLLFLVPRDAP
jgi:ubiquinone/menaquinone biosynthesis C-methylase UbiE